MYPKMPDFQSMVEEIHVLAGLQTEYGAQNVNDKIAHTAIDPVQEGKEPNELGAIRNLRPDGPRKIWRDFDTTTYGERVEGSILARSAGNVLGAIVEGWPVQEMRDWADETGHSFPPVQYWTEAKWAHAVRYGVNTCNEYTRDRLTGVPVDDDLIYTQLGVLFFEKYGPSFTTENVGTMWADYLNWVWTDMEWPLNRFRSGEPAGTAADGNPWQQMICAFIRCDPYGYVAPGWPELAAELSHRDGLMSHRRNGLYGGMFFSATIAAAFAVDDPLEALRIGLTEIPAECRLAEDIRWALETGPRLRDYADAREAIDERFAGMHTVHTLNNACLVVFGLSVGGTDVTRVISETVAMGMDNDCTAATAGSIVGAVVGKKGVPEHWYERFDDTMHSYIMDHPKFSISDLVVRYESQAQRFRAVP